MPSRVCKSEDVTQNVEKCVGQRDVIWSETHLVLNADTSEGVLKIFWRFSETVFLTVHGLVTGVKR
jgi:hypothetical protein